jgi:hypothetical protein
MHGNSSTKQMDPNRTLSPIFRWQLASVVEQRNSSPSDAEGPVRRGSGAWTRARQQQPRRLRSRAPSSSRPMSTGVRPVAAPLLFVAASVPGLTLSAARRRAARRCRAGHACRHVPSLEASRGRELRRQCTITTLADASTCQELSTRSSSYK